MENIDNNIIVNAKPYKVCLQTSEDGVEGGYYDADETWHEFGGGGADNPFVQVTLNCIKDGGNDPVSTLFTLVDSDNLPVTDLSALNDYGTASGTDLGSVDLPTNGELTMYVFKNHPVLYLYDEGSTYIKASDNTGKVYDEGGGYYELYFDEDGQHATIQYKTSQDY